MKEIIRYATLAPSGHNPQLWRFRIDKQSIAILPDLSNYDSEPLDSEELRLLEAAGTGHGVSIILLTERKSC